MKNYSTRCYKREIFNGDKQLLQITNQNNLNDKEIGKRKLILSGNYYPDNV